VLAVMETLLAVLLFVVFPLAVAAAIISIAVTL
jgi:hypothetical protein